jgi:dTDP-4-dehydrorhamnose 3,5-epimerase
MAFAKIKTEIEEVFIIKPPVFGDSRGFFMESYKRSDFILLGITEEFLQDNHSKSSYGVLRGFHYQLLPYEQSKIVRCIKGEVLDVAVDIRKKSETYGKYVPVILSEENKRMFYIPKGFAHGFLTLSKEAEIIYKVSAEYSPKYERGIRWDDSQINVNWSNIEKIVLSEKDKNWPFLKEAEIFDKEYEQ